MEDGMIRKILELKKENNWEDLKRAVREYGKGAAEEIRNIIETEYL